MPKKTKLTDYPEFGKWVKIEWNDAPADWWIAGKKWRAKDKCAKMFNPITGETDVLNFDQIIETKDLIIP